MIECNVLLKKRAQAPLACHSYLGVVSVDRCLEMPSCRSIFLNDRSAIVLGLLVIQMNQAVGRLQLR